MRIVINTACIVLGVLTCMCAGLSQASEARIDVLSALESESLDERLEASNAIVVQRDQAIARAEKIILEYAEVPGRNGTVKTSILLLGKLQAQQSVPLLVEHLTFKVFYKETKKPQTFEDQFPCIEALVEIGLASIDPLINRMSESDDQLALRCAATVIVAVLGRDAASDRLKRSISREADPLRKKRIESLLTAVSKAQRDPKNEWTH